MKQIVSTHKSSLIDSYWDRINRKKSKKIITTIGKPQYFCVGMVDIMNSTKTVARIPQDKVAKYYEIFLNNMAHVVNSHHGKILKIMGDSLLFCFPDTCNSKNKLCLLNAIECGLSMMEIHERLNQILERHSMPNINFRISLDYGLVNIMKTKDGLIDLVGPTVNTCAKINELALTNSVIIGSDLFEKIKHFREYKLKSSGYFSMGLKQSYPVFTLY